MRSSRLTMPPEGSDALLSHYMAELAYLHNAGSAFALLYPRVAGALELAPHGSTDPHVQRLIESFAFLTARLQRTYEAQLPEVPTALLDILYPQLVAPTPSMSIAAFRTDPEQSRSVAGVTVPAGTLLFATAEGAADAPTCRFRTGYPVALWPVEVADARIEPPTLYPFLDARPDVQRVLRIRLRCQGNRRFGEFAPPSLRFFLPPSGGRREAIFELLFTHLRGVAVGTIAADAPPPDGPAADARLLHGARLGEVGFAADEALLPSRPMSHQAYRLLQEYFAFPDKFLFVDVAGLPHGALGEGSHADLLLLLGAAPDHAVTVNAGSFVLGCTPIINLFPRVSEPIRLDHTRLEYPLVADIRRERSVEIHSIERVTRLTARTGRGQTVHPLFSFGRTGQDDAGTMRYYARRQPASDTAADRDEIVLSFVDPGLDPDLPAGDTVFAHVMCTNRGLAEQLGAGTRLNLEVDLPVRGVSCMMRPTRQLPPPANGAALWRLVSQLSVNHLSITGGPATGGPATGGPATGGPATGGAHGIAALREILLLYCSGDQVAAKRIDGLTQLSTRRVVRHIGSDAWRGFVRGLEITLTFDARSFADSGWYLMGSVLSRFFGLYAAVNSFTELVLVMKGGQREETWRWPALTGATELL
jgi:type VI secretion system protein ImpG